MKIIKNYRRSIYGVKYTFFTVVFNGETKHYHYYINTLWTKNIGDILVFRNKSKSKYLNKYTLQVIGVVFTIYKYSIYYPLSLIVSPLLMYIDGCTNFIKNTAWNDNVRYFNWVNIAVIIFTALWLILSSFAVIAFPI